MHKITCIITLVALVATQSACNGEDPPPDAGGDASLDLNVDQARKETAPGEMKVDQPRGDLPLVDKAKTVQPTQDLPLVDLPAPDLPLVLDLTPVLDLLQKDLPKTDLPVKPDLPQKDLPKADLPLTDLPVQKDLPVTPDLPLPDLPPPDQQTDSLPLDLPPPDLPPPDMMPPDKMLPDTVPKDYLQVVDWPIYTSTWHPRQPRHLDTGWRLAPKKKKKKATP